MSSELAAMWKRGTITPKNIQRLGNKIGWTYLRLERETGVGRCKVMMMHPAGEHSIHTDMDFQCILPASHQKHDSDHVDIHGHTARVLVRQSTIREVAALAESDRQDAKQAAESALAERVAKLLRGVQVDDPELETGLTEHHTDGSYSFPVRQGDRWVTVHVSPGWV